MREVQVYFWKGGWWASMTRTGHYLGRMDRGPFRRRWMAKLAFPIDRWIW